MNLVLLSSVHCCMCVLCASMHPIDQWWCIMLYNVPTMLLVIQFQSGINDSFCDKGDLCGAVLCTATMRAL